MADPFHTLTASIDFKSDHGFKGRPPLQGVKLRLFFRDGGKAVDATKIAPIVVPDVEASLGPLSVKVQVTISWAQKGLGIFNRTNGSLVLPIVLRFDNSVGQPASLLDVVLTTASLQADLLPKLNGQPVDPHTLTTQLVGKGSFSQGVLDQNRGEIAIAGAFDTTPF